MAAHNFMLDDIRAILAGFLLFSLVGFFPGYALGWLLDTLQFRARSLAFRLALSVPLSIAIGPILGYLVGRWLSISAVLVVYAVACLCGLFRIGLALLDELRLRRRLSRGQLAAFGLIGVWLLIAVLSLADMQFGNRLYYSTIGFDYAVRTAFTNAITTTGIPPQSPFFFPGHPVALRYHYFWLILCSLVQRIGGPLVDARQALVAGTMWCGVGLMCVVALYLRCFSPNGAAGIARRSLIGIALLGVTGLDILGALLLVWLNHIGLIAGISPSVEWWNNQVDGWVYTMLWEPHYLSALIACLTGFLLLWDAPQRSMRGRAVASVLAGLALATAVGAGIYVAFVFAIFLALWAIITLAKRWYRETAVLAMAGAVAGASSLPYLVGLRSSGAGSGGGQLLHFTVRSFSLGELLLRVLHFDRPWQIVLGNSLFLPLNYFLELGFFFVAGLLVWRQFRRQPEGPTRQQLAAFTMAATSVVVCTFLRSGIIANNDLGWRGFLVAQFMLLIWAADLLSGPIAARGKGSILIPLLALGVSGVVYDLAILRFFPLLSDEGKVPKIGWMAADENLGRRTYASREAYEWIRARTPARAIIQQNPRPELQDTTYGLYANRQTVAEDASCATVFGGDLRECIPVMARLTGLFSSDGKSPSTSFAAACKSLPIDVVAARDTDPVWNDRSSWVWNRTPIYANQFFRLFACR
ncbi:MAG: hypothetical protein ACLQKA_11390 [Bryobacteraceae bacterium]